MKAAAALDLFLPESKVAATVYRCNGSVHLPRDRRFNFRDSNLIAYLSVWNAYNRKNVAQYFWNQVRNEPDVIYQ